VKRLQEHITESKDVPFPGGPADDYPRQAGRIAGGDEKLFYKIGEVSALTGLEPYVLRYWETEFPVLRPRKSRGGQRVYRRKDVENILRIKQMLYSEGYTISGARKALGRKSPGNESASPGFLVKLRTDLADILRILSSHDHRGKDSIS
jgi:DNA-binding transcriptional MerR regulator